jgi:hypothetical protein
MPIRRADVERPAAAKRARSRRSRLPRVTPFSLSHLKFVSFRQYVEHVVNRAQAVMLHIPLDGFCRGQFFNVIRIVNYLKRAHAAFRFHVNFVHFLVCVVFRLKQRQYPVKLDFEIHVVINGLLGADYAGFADIQIERQF